MAIDRQSRPLYIDPMATDNPTQVSEVDLNKLEFRVNELVQVCERLKDENRSLRAQQETLVAERATLIDRNEQARVRVEAMINRLKAMEQNG
jgi:cell division protein ZapB